MFFPARMHKVEILVHRDHLDNVLTSLHESGIMELSSYEDEELSPIQTKEGEGETLTKVQLRINKLLEILRPYAEPQRSLIKQFLSPDFPDREPVTKQGLATILNHANMLLGEGEATILKADIELESITSKISERKDKVSILEFVAPLHLDLARAEELQTTTVVIGKVTEPKEFAKAFSEIELAHSMAMSSGESMVGAIIYHNSVDEDVQKAVKGCFHEIAVPMMGVPQKALVALEKDISHLEKEADILKEEMADLNKIWRTRLLVAREELRIAREKFETTESLSGTASTAYIKGWVPTKEKEALEELVEKASHGMATCGFEKAEDEAPIKLENPGWSRPFQGLVSMYSPPKYNEFDPTFTVALFFSFFFGFMLGDAGYGIIIIILASYALMKGGRVTEYMKDWCVLGLYLGSASAIFGFLTGSLFGDTIPRFFYAHSPGVIPSLYNVTVFGMRLPYDGILNPLGILGLALISGILCLNVGLILAGILNLKQGKVKAFFTDQVSWFLLQLGGGILIAQFLLSMTDFESNIITMAGIMVLAGMGLAIAEKKALFMFDLTGFVGDWLSFARLMGLGLATAIVAVSINVLIELIVAGGGIMIVAGVAIAIFGHGFNLGSSTLGAYIHAMRLHYVEYFSKFYDGGGEPFSPFRSKRRFTDLEREVVRK